MKFEKLGAALGAGRGLQPWQQVLWPPWDPAPARPGIWVVLGLTSGEISESHGGLLFLAGLLEPWDPSFLERRRSSEKGTTQEDLGLRAPPLNH